TRFSRDWSSDVCSSDLFPDLIVGLQHFGGLHKHRLAGGRFIQNQSTHSPFVFGQNGYDHSSVPDGWQCPLGYPFLTHGPCKDLFGELSQSGLLFPETPPDTIKLRAGAVSDHRAIIYFRIDQLDNPATCSDGFGERE